MKILQKKILFIAHSNNDFDHLLPILDKLSNMMDYKPYILFINSKEDVVINNIHEQINGELNIVQISLNELFKYRILFKWVLKISRNISSLYGFISIKYMLSHLRFDLLILKLINRIIVYFLNRTISIYLPVITIKEFLIAHSFSMILLDIQHQKQDGVKRNIMSYTISNLMKESKINKTPIFMISHGAVIRFNTSIKEIHDESILTPDVLTLCNSNEISVYQNLIGPNTQVLILGETRYDIQWINKLENMALKYNPIQKPKNKFVILIIAANLTFIKNDSIISEINSEILKLLNENEDIELWFKAHPRYPSYTTIKPTDRVRVFYNDVDTNFLLTLSDIIISPFSGVLFQPIIQGKKVIYFDIWKKYCSNDTFTVFDNTRCVYKASSYEELKKGVLALRRNPILEEEDAEEFYQSIISGGIPRNESIIDRYIKAMAIVLH